MRLGFLRRDLAGFLWMCGCRDVVSRRIGSPGKECFQGEATVKGESNDRKFVS